MRIEHQLGRVLPRLLVPELDESQDFVGLLELGNPGVGVAEDTMVSISSQERQDAILAATPPGNVVFFQWFRLAISGDGVEIDVEGRTSWPAGSMNFGQPCLQHPET
jgi:hypothetical protein